jgi:deoxyribose-phosphate aldolase
MRLSSVDLLQRIDLSAVRAGQSDHEIQQLVDTARTNGCGLVTVLPNQTALARSLLGTGLRPGLGGNAGFPAGGQTTHIKVAETRELLRLGCTEIDMVVDLSALLSGRLKDVKKDIAAVVETAAGKTVKVILECAYLSDLQMRQGCEAVIDAGAAFVKTGSGWAPGAATPQMVRLLKDCTGDQAEVKASGGIRTLVQLLELYAAGARRFGLGLRSAAPILTALTAQPFFDIPGVD